MDLRRISQLGLYAGLLLALAACSPSPDVGSRDQHASESAEQFTLTLLHINDHHSHLDESHIPLLMNTHAGVREPVQLPVGGFARVATAIDEIATQSAEPVIKIHAGDAITGDLYYSLTQGKADADLMNVVCFDSFTLGNHEFDYGDTALKEFIEHLRSNDHCKTAVLSANVEFAADSALHPSRAPGYVQPSVVLERDGRRIGLIGITVADKTQNASRPDPGTHFTDETMAAQTEIDRLTQLGVDIIVLQTHYGYQADLKMASLLRGVDVIVGGDSHTLLGPPEMAHYGLSPRGPYPTHATDAEGNSVCIVQAGHYAYIVGEVNLAFDDAGHLTACEGRPHILVGEDFKPAQPGRVFTSDDYDAVYADIERSGFFRLTQASSRAEAILAPYRDKKQEFGSSVVAHAQQTLCSRRIPGPVAAQTTAGGSECQGRSQLQVHGGEIQQLVALAFLQQARTYFDADLALVNAGGIRTDVPQGPMTVKDIYTLLPFQNTLVQLKISGATLKAALESAVAAALDERPSTGAYPYAAGIRWTVDNRRPSGDKLVNLEVMTSNGSFQPLDLERIYKVATIDFIAEGKDHYDAFGSLDASQIMDVGLDATELFLDYARAQDQLGNGLRVPAPGSFSTHTYIPAR